MAAPANHQLLEDQIRGLTYGQAIGDAIGLLTEFMHKDEAQTHYGDKNKLEYEHKVNDHHRSRWKTGDWTDDTDQMILIMLSVLDQNGVVSPVDFAAKMKHWAQRGFSELGDVVGMGLGSTTSHVLKHDMFKTDPHQASYDIWEKTGKEVAPNGAIMRTSILGAYKYNSIPEVHKNTLDICKVTHADPRCQASVVAMTTAISLMLQHDEKHLKEDDSYNIDLIIKESYKAAKLLLTKASHKKEMKKYMFSTSIKDLVLDDKKAIGYTFKCLGAGFWAFKQNDFRSALQELLMEGGDADTNGAVAGALLGCKLGTKGFPSSWLNGLLHKEWLDKIIDRFLPLIIPSYVRQFTNDGSSNDNVK